MTKLSALLQQKRLDVDQRKLISRLIVPDDDRRLIWDPSAFRIIAELKRASLSAGKLPDNDLVSLCRSYEVAGASAVSVLTEEHYFHGSLQDLRDIKAITKLPVLQKDFIVDPFQILEAKEAGADFVLLIARILSREMLSEMLDLCEQIKMNALVEITEEAELLKLERPVVFLGVNSRDLDTLAIDTARFQRLRPRLPESFLIAESGIGSTDLLQKVMDLGYNGALIGEHFLRAADPGAEVRKFVRFAGQAIFRAKQAECLRPIMQAGSLRSIGQGRTSVKVCGITREFDALLAIECGASALGFIFADSPRRINVDTLKEFRQRIPGGILCVGVFRGQTANDIERIMAECKLNIAQLYDDVPCSFPVWRSRSVSSIEEMSEFAPGLNNNFLLDIKLKEADLPCAWNRLRNESVFALAGGLHPGNVSTAVSIVRPQWIDVARGVESSPGIKDETKLRDFVKAVNHAQYA